MVLEEIAAAGVVSEFNKIAQKRYDMSCAYCLIIHIGLTTRYLFFIMLAAGKITAGLPILVVVNPMVV